MTIYYYYVIIESSLLTKPTCHHNVQIWAKKMRPIFAKGHPDLDNGPISTLLGIYWKQQTSTEKKEFRDLADLEKEQHRLKYPAYKYQPKINKKRLTKSLISNKSLMKVKAVKHDVSKLVDRCVTPCQLDFDISETKNIFPFDSDTCTADNLLSADYMNGYLVMDSYMSTDFGLYSSESPCSASFSSSPPSPPFPPPPSPPPPSPFF